MVINLILKSNRLNKKIKWIELDVFSNQNWSHSIKKHVRICIFQCHSLFAHTCFNRKNNNKGMSNSYTLPNICNKSSLESHLIRYSFRSSIKYNNSHTSIFPWTWISLIISTIGIQVVILICTPVQVSI